jgi:replicative DNA helicase
MEQIPLVNIEAEQSALGSCLIGGLPAVLQSKEILSTSDFYREQHRMIYENICTLVDNNKPVDIIALAESLGKQLDKIGGYGYLVTIANTVPNSDNLKHYAEIVKKKSVARQEIENRRQEIDQLYKEEDPYEVIGQANLKAADITSHKTKTSIVHAKQIGIKVFEGIGERKESNGIPGIPTGFRDLDLKTGGLRGNKLIILAARPSMGKTTFALNIARQVAFTEKKNTLIFSLEMTAEELIEKLMVMEAGVDQGRIQNIRTITESDWSKLGNALNAIAESTLYIVDTKSKINDLTNQARFFRATHDLGLIIIDYLQLLDPAKKTDNRNNDVSDISKALKQLARELNIPILALSQLSRAVEHRENKIPSLADLRESGSLEQDADIVEFLYREDYYNKDKPQTDPSITQLILAKNRGGPLGLIEMQFTKNQSRFNLLEQHMTAAGDNKERRGPH